MKQSIRSLLVVFAIILLMSLLLIGAWLHLDNHYDSGIDWKEINANHYVDTQKINYLLENESLHYDYPIIKKTSQYTYEIIIGRYRKHQNAAIMKNKIESIVGQMIIEKNQKDYWVLSSTPMTSRTQVDLIKIKLNNLKISPQIIRRKIALEP